MLFTRKGEYNAQDKFRISLKESRLNFTSGTWSKILLEIMPIILTMYQVSKLIYFLNNAMQLRV